MSEQPFQPGGLRPDLVEKMLEYDRRLRALERGTVSVGFTGNGASLTNFGLGTSAIILATNILSVPKWANKAIILAVANVSAQNSTAGLGYLLCLADINGSSGGASQVSVGAGEVGAVFASAQRQIDNPTDPITISSKAYVSPSSWAVTSTNISNVDGIAIFLR